MYLHGKSVIGIVAELEHWGVNLLREKISGASAQLMLCLAMKNIQVV